MSNQPYKGMIDWTAEDMKSSVATRNLCLHLYFNFKSDGWSRYQARLLSYIMMKWNSLEINMASGKTPHSPYFVACLQFLQTHLISTSEPEDSHTANLLRKPNKKWILSLAKSMNCLSNLNKKHKIFKRRERERREKERERMCFCFNRKVIYPDVMQTKDRGQRQAKVWKENLK